MVCAGYAMYGSATNLVISFGLNNGVHGFTLDPSIGEFVLTHPSITIPKSGKIYSVNEGNARNWNKPTTAYVQNAKYKEDGSNFSLRYTNPPKPSYCYDLIPARTEFAKKQT